MAEAIVAKARIRDWMDLVLTLAGSGLASTVVETVRSWSPDMFAGWTDEAIQTAIGFVLLYWGDRIHSRVPAFGLGIFISGAGDWLASIISPMISGILRK